MKIVTSDSLEATRQVIEGTSVRFVAEDGRDAFEVSIGRDGRSIEVRGISSYRVDGVLYREKLEICAEASNSITISSKPH